MFSRLGRLSPDKVVRVRALTGDIVFGHWAGMQASPFSPCMWVEPRLSVPLFKLIYCNELSHSMPCIIMTFYNKL